MIGPPSLIPLNRLDKAAAFRARLYRYFFYGWLFRDVDTGTDWERSAAVRHNRWQARLLPIYMMRWLAAGTGALALEVLAEAAFETAWPSAALALLVIVTIMFNLITGVVWAFLHFSRGRR